MAYALDAKGKKPAKTVLRAGYGIFYDRWASATCWLPPSRIANSGQRAGNEFFAHLPQRNQPYEHRLLRLPSAAALHSHSAYDNGADCSELSLALHASVRRQPGAAGDEDHDGDAYLSALVWRAPDCDHDANAYEPGQYVVGATVQPNQRPNPSLGIVNEYYPEAVFKQNQMIVNVNARISPKFSVFGFYNLSFANSDGAGGTASNSYNLSQDYGRAGFVSRNMVFLMGNYTGPWGIRFNPFLIAHSGRPYNIVSGLDLTGDNFLNDRPAYADPSMCDPSTDGGQYVSTTQYGCLDTQPTSGENLLPMNLGNSPASVAFNLRLTARSESAPSWKRSGGDGGPPPGGGPGGGGHRGGGGPGGGFGPGGFGGGGGGPRGMFGSQANARKYNLTFSAQALNLFNNINYGTPTGTVGSTAIKDSNGTITGYSPGNLFGQSRGLAGQIFSSGTASRRIFIQAIFSF